MEPVCTPHMACLLGSDVQICFPASYLNLHSLYSHMPNMPGAELAPVCPIGHRRRQTIGVCVFFCVWHNIPAPSVATVGEFE